METNSKVVKKPPHLWLRFYIERPLFEKEQLDALQNLINTHLGNWAVTTFVGKGERQRNRYRVTHKESLFEAVNKVAPVRWGQSMAVLEGAYQGVSFFLDSSRQTVPPELNYFSVEVVDIQNVERKPAPNWASTFFKDATVSLPVRYGNARLSEEFDSKNMLNDEEGVRAIGLKLDESLPGLYWLNYFGPPYTKLIGKDRLLSCPAYSVEAVGEGVLISLAASPFEWQSSEYRTRERSAIDHLGERFFFSKSDPERATIGPDFRS